MKNKITFYFVMIVLGIFCVHCTKYDDYKKYLEGGEIIYPQKADSVKTFPGKNRILLEWVIIDPKVTSCKVLYVQSAEKDSLFVPIDTRGGAEDDTTRIIIDNLIETTYTFYITSYDDYENSSITVETEESAYGEIYENALVNRVLKSKLFGKEGLQLEWYSGDETEVSVEVSYIDNDEKPQVYYMPHDSTIAKIKDFNVAYPFSYRTLYKPDSLAIDTFYTSKIEDKVEFQTELSNTVAPYSITTKGWWVQGRFGTPTGWIINEAANQNGNVDNASGHVLALWAWSGYSPAGSFRNGKMYQTILLEEGTYALQATVKDVSPVLNKGYLLSSVGYTLSDIDQVETEALSFYKITTTPRPQENDLFECRFTLESPTIVSLGLVANIDHMEQIQIKKIELLKE